jgi:hypothetical protein
MVGGLLFEAEGATRSLKPDRAVHPLGVLTRRPRLSHSRSLGEKDFGEADHLSPSISASTPGASAFRHVRLFGVFSREERGTIGGKSGLCAVVPCVAQISVTSPPISRSNKVAVKDCPNDQLLVSPTRPSAGDSGLAARWCSVALCSSCSCACLEKARWEGRVRWGDCDFLPSPWDGDLQCAGNGEQRVQCLRFRRVLAPRFAVCRAAYPA